LSMYASSGPEGLAFQTLVDDYGAGDDFKLGRIVLQIHAFISTLPDPQRWLEDALNRARLDGPNSLLAELHKKQFDRLRTELQTQMDYCTHLAQAIKEAWPVAVMHAEAVSDHYFVLKRWLDKLDTARPECWEQVAEEIRQFQFGRAKPRPR